jgi:uncharacterized protein YecT (DUF1311 family)
MGTFRMRRQWARLISVAPAMLFCVLFGGALFPASGQEAGNVQEGATRQAEPPAAPPHQNIFRAQIPSEQLAFLNSFAGQDSDKAIRDKKYRKMLHNAVPNCVFHYGSDMPLSDALDMVLKGSTLPVKMREGRYMLVSGRSGPYLSGRGFMWIDIQAGIALGGFYFHPTNGEPTPTVTIFSKQVKETNLRMSQLPREFARDLNEWSVNAHVPKISTRYFISGANEKILLEHDEDYCAFGDATGAGKDACEQANADAADTDLNAAYYLKETHHATNGTAWMITGQDQVAWIQARDVSCRVDPYPLRCHIWMTRERTRVILYANPPPVHAPHI